MSKEEMATWMKLAAIAALVAGIQSGVIMGFMIKHGKNWKWLKKKAEEWDNNHMNDDGYNDETDNPYRLTIWECMF